MARLRPGIKDSHPPRPDLGDLTGDLLTDRLRVASRLGVKVYGWQYDVMRDVGGMDRPRVAYCQVPRKNGKTLLAAVIAATELLLRPERHIYAISDSERNLKSVFWRALTDLLAPYSASLWTYQHRIESPHTASTIEIRPANVGATQGINPHLVIFDEVHMAQSAVWSGMVLAGAARRDAMVLGITSPGYDLASPAHDLYTAAKADDPTLWSRIYEAPVDAKLDDREAWKAANPAGDEIGSQFWTAMEADLRRLPEHDFRRFRLGQWTTSGTAWLPHGSWDSVSRVGPEPEDGTPVVLGFDGSYSQDSTALVGCTIGPVPHLFVIGAWERPGTRGWTVPRAEVELAVQESFRRWNVKRFLVDPPYWQRELGEWAERWGARRVLEFPTWSRSRMAPACTEFAAAVLEGKLTHDGDARLTRHIANVIPRPSPAGTYIGKASDDSPAKIDLAVAAVVAYTAARQMRNSARLRIIT